MHKPSPFVVCGAGFFGAVVAERIASQLDQNVLIVDKRPHTGGNCYSKTDEGTGIHYHPYGTHIFHTSNETVWRYISQFTTFNGYYHQVLTTHRGKVYQMPINLETINSFYNVSLRPYEVDAFLEREIKRENIEAPRNFEEKAISMIGRPLYEAFIKGYTFKQWQKDPKELPASILNRLPFRTSYNENYFFSRHQGIPTDGYGAIFDKLLDHPNISVQLNTDFFTFKPSLPADTHIIYTGPIDRYFDYRYGPLEWRSLRFEHDVKSVGDYQGTSVMNYADLDIPYTRIHEPRHLHPETPYDPNHTLIIKEFSCTNPEDPYYPINNPHNQRLFQQYSKAAKAEKNVYFGGRLGEYKYFDMHHTIAKALSLFETKLKHLPVST